jgi:cytochrome b subunit of formate dehydrogenase
MNNAAIAGDLPRATPALTNEQRYYRRFDPLTRWMHGLLMFSFLGVSLSGLPLIVADHGWAKALARLLGGFESAMIIHRVSAFVMIVLFVGHIVRVTLRAYRTRGWKAMLWGPNSMVPQPQDGIDIWNNLKWFIGKGPRPVFDRYTYWEKFDYWAVFWGMAIIGGSGLMLWFPTFFSLFVPGWVLNIAMLIHGEEALLAMGFIFTIHFFNGHLRPEKFPMDPVIFTGVISEHEMKEERTNEYKRLVAEGRLQALEAGAPKRSTLLAGYVVGGAALLIGVVTVALIIYSFLL